MFFLFAHFHRIIMATFRCSLPAENLAENF